MLDRVHAASLPGRLLQELADAPPSAVLQRVRSFVVFKWNAPSNDMTYSTMTQNAGRCTAVGCFLRVRKPQEPVDVQLGHGCTCLNEFDTPF